MIKEQEIISKVKNNIQTLFKSTGFIKSTRIQSGVRESVYRFSPDIVIEIETVRKKKFILVFEVKSTGQPRYVRIAVSQLKEIIANKKQYYGVFASTFISEESRKICRESEIGFIDLAGNCFLNFDNVYLSVEGRPNLYPTTRPLKTIFYPKSSRVLRVLLCNPKKKWFVKDLAKEAETSIGQTSLIKNKLLEYEYLGVSSEKKRAKFWLEKPEELLSKWTNNYTYKKNKMKIYYSIDDVETIEREIIDYFNLKNITYAFTLNTGASMVAPFLRYKRVFLYVFNDIDKIAREMNFKEVSSGSNVILMEPYDEGVFYGLQMIRGVRVVSDIQLYLDLVNYKERGEEAAKFLLEERLKKQW